MTSTNFQEWAFEQIQKGHTIIAVKKNDRKNLYWYNPFTNERFYVKDKQQEEPLNGIER